MARVTYTPEEIGREMEAPSGYYVPRELVVLEYEGKRLLYVLGTVCIEASCCGIGQWGYARVHGYVVDAGLATADDVGTVQIDTIEDEGERQAIVKRLMAAHPGARVEFR